MEKFMNKVVLIDDHHEALGIWRKNSFRNLDLVHIDAHVDFQFYPVRPKEEIFHRAKSIEKLKIQLERNILYKKYINDLDKQMNVGNYIYPAMSECIVKDFYWVIPGGLKEFEKSLKYIKYMLKVFAKEDAYQNTRKANLLSREGIISTSLLGRKFSVCILEKLPVLTQHVLLDIDTDFLIIDNIRRANNIEQIARRKPWISPSQLICTLLKIKKIKPAFTTISYSVNGGYTPMRYKILGDELAYCLSPKYFKTRYPEKRKAALFFDRFESTGEKKYYQKAVNLDASYKAADNNYGPLYLKKREFSKAKKEFLKIAEIDAKNPYPFIGLGNIEIGKKSFLEAKKHFSYALRLKNDLPDALFGLARTELALKNFNKAKGLFHHYKSLRVLDPQSSFYLGSIYEKEKDFKNAINWYMDAIRLGKIDSGILLKLLRISLYVSNKSDIIKFIYLRYQKLDKSRKLLGQRLEKHKALLKVEKKNMETIRKILRKEAKNNERLYSLTEE